MSKKILTDRYRHETGEDVPFRAIAEMGNDGILVCDGRDKIVFANQVATAITEYSRDKLVGKGLSALLGKENRSLLKDIQTNRHKYGQKFCTEMRIVTALGGVKEAEVCIAFSKSKGKMRTYVYLRDITERKRFEREIKESEERYKNLFERVQHGIFISSKGGRFLDCNRALLEMLGYRSKEEFLKIDIAKDLYVNPRDRRTFQGLVEKEGFVKDFEVEFKRKDGRKITILLTAHPIRNEGGKVPGYEGLNIDITERKEMERKLQEAMGKFQKISEMGEEGILVIDERNRIIFANSMATELIGYSNGELLRMKFTDLLNSRDRKFLAEMHDQVGLDESRRVCTEMGVLRADGRPMDAEVCITIARPEAGRIDTYIYLKDITERKKMVTEIGQTNEFLTKLIASSVDGIIAADMKGSIIIFNKAAEDLLGYKAEEVMGKINIVDLYPPGEAKEVMRKLRGQEYRGVGKLSPQQVTLVDKFGEHIPIQLSASLVYDEQGKELFSVGFFTDLRPRIKMEKELEETHLQLVNSEKMASLGKLAAGIAHEINNPMGGILIYSSLLMEALEAEDSRRQDLEKIVQEATRCKEIVKSLLEFSRQTGPKMEPTDINKAITDDLFFLENQALFHNIEIVKNLDPQLSRVRGNASQLKQVFMNIIVNAAEAMHGSGTLTITTGLSADKKEIWIDFADTGEGIPQENVSKIFDPFFTTKEVGKGTGLGLSTSYGIIDGHGGQIVVKSQVGKGTTFRIELPAAGEDAEFL
ncbi:MAG: PAS domain S-box protein [Thermodesulfobacteriota bacterium]